MNIPNILTLFRIILIPLFAAVYYMSNPDEPRFYACMIFAIACITDLLDGFLARKLNKSSRFGAFLDPVADKFTVCTAMVLIVEHYATHKDLIVYSQIITIPALCIICREIIISALREWMAELGKRANVQVRWIGKWKTTFQMFAIGGLVWKQADWMVYASTTLLYVALILTLISMFEYLKAAWSDLTADM